MSELSVSNQNNKSNPAASCDYITVLTMDVPTGKRYSVVGGELKKTPAANNANGWAVTRHVPDVESFAELNREISNDPNKAIVLGFIRGTEDGQPYRLMSTKDFEAFTKINGKNTDKFYGKPLEADGLKYATRTKRMFHASSWIVFDRDTVDGMPDELEPDAPLDRWMSRLCEAFPEVADVDYMAVPSASNRVIYNGKPCGDGNYHVYMQIVEAIDSERFGKAALIHSFARGCGFLRPTKDRRGNTIGQRMWTLFDPTTFSRERLCFDGSPIIDQACPEAQRGLIYIVPTQPIIWRGSKRRADTRLLPMPSKEERKRLDLDITINKGGRVTSINTLDLRPDVVLEYKHPISGDIGEMTMGEFVAGSLDRMRCQTPFRPDSNSWAGYVSKEDGCHPFLHDVGTHVNYLYNDVKEQFMAATVGTNGSSGESVIPSPPNNINESTTYKPNGIEVIIEAESSPVPTPPEDHKPNTINDVNYSKAVVTSNINYGFLHRTAPEFAESDLANAQRFVGSFRHTLRYVPIHKSWFEWNGFRWKKCEGGREYAMAHAIVEVMVQEAVQRPDDDSFRKWAKISSGSNAIRNMVKEASVMPEIVTPSREIDRHWYLFGVANGMVDLRLNDEGGGDGQSLRGFVQPDKSVFLTKGSDVPYVDGATCPTWERTVWEIFSGDGELVSFFQKFVGYTLMGLPREEVTAFLVGEGSNGKSTVTGVLESLMGEYKSTINKNMLMAREASNGESPTPGLARLKGVRMAVVTETKEGDVLDESVIKSLSGSDTVIARNLNSDPFEFKPMFVTWIATNHPPIIKTDDFGTWRRVIEIPFKRNFLKEIGADKLDTGLADRIIETELPGVLLWAMEGARLYQLEGLGLPDKVRHATEGYRQSMDMLADWMNQCCEIGPEFEATYAQLWNSYKTYSQSTDDQLIRSGRILNRKITSKGFETIQNAAGTRDRGFKGLKLKFKSPTG